MNYSWAFTIRLLHISAPHWLLSRHSNFSFHKTFSETTRRTLRSSLHVTQALRQRGPKHICFEHSTFFMRFSDLSSTFKILLHGSIALMRLGLRIVDVSRSHSGTPHSVGPLYMSDRPVAETSTWQHTTLKTDGHPCPLLEERYFFLLTFYGCGDEENIQDNLKVIHPVVF